MRPTVRGAVVGLAVLVAVAVGALLSPDAVVSRLREVVLSPWFPVALVGLYLVRPFLAWPITALSVLVGYRYGLVVGLPVALAGAVGTSLIPYVAARRFGGGDGLVGRLTDGATRFFGATGDLRGIVAARLAPTPAEPVSAAAGLARVSVPAFAAGTAVGELPWTIAAVVAGDSMRTLAFGTGFDPRLLAVAAVAATVLLAGPAYRTWRERRPDPR